jgi:hypothetical protein
LFWGFEDGRGVVVAGAAVAEDEDPESKEEEEDAAMLLERSLTQQAQNDAYFELQLQMQCLKQSHDIQKQEQKFRRHRRCSRLARDSDIAGRRFA